MEKYKNVVGRFCRKAENDNKDERTQGEFANMPKSQQDDIKDVAVLWAVR